MWKPSYTSAFASISNGDVFSSMYSSSYWFVYLFSPMYCSSFYLWMICTYSHPCTAYLDTWVSMVILSNGRWRQDKIWYLKRLPVNALEPKNYCTTWCHSYWIRGNTQSVPYASLAEQTRNLKGMWNKVFSA